MKEFLKCLGIGAVFFTAFIAVCAFWVAYPIVGAMVILLAVITFFVWMARQEM